MTIYFYYCVQESPRRNGEALRVNKSVLVQYLVQSQKWQNDLDSFPRQTIQHDSNPSLRPDQKCWRSWIWMVLWRPTRPSRTNTKKRCPFHHRGLECKLRKQCKLSSGKFELAVQNEAEQRLIQFCQENTLVIANALFQQYERPLYTWISPDG